MTLTPEQFDYLKKRLSEKKQGGYLSRLSSTVKERFGEATETYAEAARGNINPLRAGVTLAKDVSGIAVAPITEAIAPIMEKTIAPALTSTTEAITETKPAQGVIDVLSKYPEFSGVASDLLETFTNVAALAGTLETFTNVAALAGTGEGGAAVSAPRGVVTKGTELAQRGLTKLADTRIDPRVKTVLKEVPPEKLESYIKAGLESLEDQRLPTPIEKVASMAERINRVIKEDLTRIGRQKEKTIEAVGHYRAPNIATKQIEKIKPLLQKKLTDGERKLLNQYMSELKLLGVRPTLKSVDATIDKLQHSLAEYAQKLNIPTSPRIKAFINGSIRELNDDLKSIVDDMLGSKDYSSLNNAYRTKLKLFNVLNKSLGEEGTKIGSLVNRFFSGTDSSIKQLFAKIKEIYGVDLAQDAILAKFVTDTLKIKPKPSLGLPPLTKQGLIDRIITKTWEQLVRPKRVLEAAKERTRPFSSLREVLKESPTENIQ